MAPTSIEQASILAEKASKRFYINHKCVEKKLTIHYTNKYWKKHLELRNNYILEKMQIFGL